MSYEQKNCGKTGKATNDRSYVEELSPSDCFYHQNLVFVLTQDHKKDSSRLGICLHDGCSRWFPASTIVEKIELYTTNNDGHLVKLHTNEQTTEQD